jgi:hypothetical protein
MEQEPELREKLTGQWMVQLEELQRVESPTEKERKERAKKIRELGQYLKRDARFKR